MQIRMGCCPAGDGRGRDAHEIGDGPLHVLLPYSDAVGAGGRHLRQRPGEVVPPGARQLEVVLEDRVVGQDRITDAHRQLRSVGDAVVDRVVDHQESGPAAVEVAESVWASRAPSHNFPAALSSGADTSRSQTGTPVAVQAGTPRVRPAHPQNSTPGSTWTSRAFAVCAWWARMRCSVSGSGGGEYTSDLPQLGGGQGGLSDGVGRLLPVWRTRGGDKDVCHSWA